MAVVEKTSQCLIQMLQLYALCEKKKSNIFFVEEHMALLMNALKTDKKIVQKRVLKCIYWAVIQAEYQIKLPSDKRVYLETQIQSLLQSEDKSIQNTSIEIYKVLQDKHRQGVY